MKRYPYKKGEWPIERLRNKLSSLFTLIDYLSLEVKSKKADKLIKNSQKDREDILLIINDLENL